MNGIKVTDYLKASARSTLIGLIIILVCNGFVYVKNHLIKKHCKRESYVEYIDVVDGEE